MGGTLIVSLDFELFWGMLDKCPLEDYQDHVLGGRAAIPQLLALFQKYGIHATWAAVGFLFGENYQEISRFSRKRTSGRPMPILPWTLTRNLRKSEKMSRRRPAFTHRLCCGGSPRRQARRLPATPFPTITAGRRGRRWSSSGQIYGRPRPLPRPMATM